MPSGVISMIRLAIVCTNSWSCDAKMIEPVKLISPSFNAVIDSIIGGV